jgi:endo-alpha-1,4-polygalactosaminidase (GH114 family)
MFAEVIDGQGQAKNRVFALAVQVGEVALDQSKAEATANLGAANLETANLKNKLSNNQRRFTPAIEVNSKEQQLILLPAQETVIQ